MERISGPPCPGCGCQDSDVIRSRYRLTAQEKIQIQRHRCRFCGREFEGPPQPAPVELPVIDWRVIACPWCDSTETKIESTRPQGVRYHRCLACRSTFKSREVQ